MTDDEIIRIPFVDGVIEYSKQEIRELGVNGIKEITEKYLSENDPLGKSQIEDTMSGVYGLVVYDCGGKKIFCSRGISRHNGLNPMLEIKIGGEVVFITLPELISIGKKEAIKKEYGLITNLNYK